MTSRHSDITVIVTNYNYGTFLEEAVASVLGQEGGPPQVIVVDDGSTDPETLEVLDRLPEGVRSSGARTPAWPPPATPASPPPRRRS